MATGGFGSQVTANTSEDLKKVLGGAAYLFTGLTRFSELKAAYGELEGPDFHWKGELLALGIGNGRQAGGGHVLCPAHWPMMVCSTSAFCRRLRKWSARCSI